MPLTWKIAPLPSSVFPCFGHEQKYVFHTPEKEKSPECFSTPLAERKGHPRSNTPGFLPRVLFFAPVYTRKAIYVKLNFVRRPSRVGGMPRRVFYYEAAQRPNNVARPVLNLKMAQIHVPGVWPRKGKNAVLPPCA